MKANCPVENMRHAVVAWIDVVEKALQTSCWAEALSESNVSMIDACRAEIVSVLLRAARGDASATSPGTVSRVISAVRYGAYRVKLAVRHWNACRHSPSPRHADVLFWPQLISHADHHLPLIQRLRDQRVTSQCIVNRAAEFEFIHRRLNETVFVGRPWRRQLAEGRRKANRARKVLQRPLDIELPQFVSQTAPWALEKILRAALLGVNAAFYAAAAAAWAAIEDCHPKVLVVGNDITLDGRTQCLVARQHGVSTVCLMHGLVSGEPLQGRHVADAYLAYGERSKQELIELGEKPGRLHVTGAVHLAKLKRQTGMIDPQVKRFVGLVEEQPWVLVATSGPGHSISVTHHRRVIEAVMRLSVDMPHIKFVAKLHPKDRLAHYDAARRNVPQSKLILFSQKSRLVPQNIFSWLQGCPLLLTGGSTAGIDALLMNVPVISIDFAAELAGYDYIESGATIHVHNEDELRFAINGVFANPSSLEENRSRVREFIQQSFFDIDGDPVDNAARVIAELVASSDKSTSRQVSIQHQ